MSRYDIRRERTVRRDRAAIGGRHAVSRWRRARRRRRAALRAAIGRGDATRHQAPRDARASRRRERRVRRDRQRRRHVQGRAPPRRRADRYGARQAIDLKRRQVHRAMDAGRAAAREARDELEHRIAETKAAYNAGRDGGARRAVPRSADGDGRRRGLARRSPPGDSAFARPSARSRIVDLGWTLRDYAKRVWDNSGEDNVLFLAGGIAFNILLAALPFILLLAAGADVPAAVRRTQGRSTPTEQICRVHRSTAAGARHETNSPIDKLINGPAAHARLDHLLQRDRLRLVLDAPVRLAAHGARERVRHRERARHHRRQDLRREDHHRVDAAVRRERDGELVRRAGDAQRCRVLVTLGLRRTSWAAWSTRSDACSAFVFHRADVLRAVQVSPGSARARASPPGSPRRSRASLRRRRASSSRTTRDVQPGVAVHGDADGDRRSWSCGSTTRR